MLAGINAYLGLALLATTNKPGGRHRSHSALLDEGCSLLRKFGQIDEEVGAKKLMVVDESDAAELAKGLAQCKSSVDNR